MLANFDLQVASIFSTKYRVSWYFCSGEEAQNRFYKDRGHGGNVGFSIGTIFAIFDLQVTPILPTKFQVHWPRGVANGLSAMTVFAN